MKTQNILSSFLIAALISTTAAQAQSEVSELTDIKERCSDRIANFGENLAVKTFFKYKSWGQTHGSKDLVTVPLAHAYAELSVKSWVTATSTKEGNIAECGDTSSDNLMTFKIYVKPRFYDLPSAATDAIEFEYEAKVGFTKFDSQTPVTVTDVKFESCRANMRDVTNGYFFDKGLIQGDQLPRSDLYRENHTLLAITESVDAYCEALKFEVQNAITNQYRY